MRKVSIRVRSGYLAGLALLVLVLVPGPCRAQTTGSIRGVVSTGGTPLPGVVVEARSPNLQGTRTATTDIDGRFTLTLLPPGTYAVTATLSGFGARSQTVPLALNAPASLNFELLPAKTAEVNVTAEAGQVETTSNTVGRNLTDTTFKSFATGRNYSSVVQLNSGIGTDGSDDRNPSITVYGSTGLENTFLVDGSNTTEIEYGGQGKVLNFEFIQEVEFKSGGYEAEYGHALGGILNVVTKSGGNELHGDAFGYLDRDSLQADSKHEEEVTAQGVPTGFRKADFGADLGGYFVKDRLWYFAAYDRVDNTLDRRVTTGPEAGLLTNLKTKSDLYSMKLTGRISDENTVVATVFGDPTTDTGAVSSPIGPPSTYEGTNKFGGTDFSLRYQGTLGPRFLLTAQFTRHHQDTDLLPGPNGDVVRYEDNTGDLVTATGGFGDNGQFNQKTFNRYDYHIDGTYLLANHDIKAGFEFERITADVVRRFSGGQLVQVLNPLEGDTRNLYAHIFFASTDSTIDHPVSAPLVATPSHDIISAFLQDSFRVLPNLTINAGVRYEKQLIRGLGDVTYIDIDHFSPRIGFAWDFLKDGKTKLSGSYGHFVQAIPLDMNIRSLNGERDATILNFDPVSIAPDPEVCTQDNGCDIKGTAVNDIDPRLKPEYMDELLLGVDREVGGNWSLGLHGIYRRLRRVLEDSYSQETTNYFFFNPGDSALAPEYPPARRYFKGIELVAQKRLSNGWSMYASYLYSRLSGNFDGSFRAIGGFNAKDPNITDDFDYPEFVVNSSGLLTLDRPHQVKLQGAYIFPFGLTASLSGFYSSGTPLSRIGWWNGYGGPELFLTPRGSEGRSPSTYEIDAHFDYALKIQPVTIHFLLDAFNLLNRQQATSIDQVWAFDEADNEAPEPTNSHYGGANSFQQPRTLRVGLRISF